jgi:pimeloyl-ACP methyl ester carboxylesterase
MSEREMRLASLNGTELAYEVRGSGEPVLLVHGGIVADAMAPLLGQPALAAGRRLINFHRRGYGRSTRATGPVSVAQQADDCRALLRHLDVERAHVAGYSYGGTIALQLALDAPEVVGSLALLEPLVPGVPMDPAAQQYFMDALGTAFGRYGAGDRAGAIDAWAGGAFGSGYRSALEAALPGAFDGAVADADTLFQVEAATLQQWTLAREDAATITAPALLLSQADPSWAGFSATHDLLREWLPRAESILLRDATHLLMITRPREVAEALASFFAHHPLSGPG